jgi:recombination endonuclease VII
MPPDVPFIAPSCPCAAERPHPACAGMSPPTPPVPSNLSTSRRCFRGVRTLVACANRAGAATIGLTMTNARDRQRYAEDPVYRAKRIAKNLQWYSANRDWLNEERRHRYATDPDYRAKLLSGNRKKRREHNLRRLYGLSLEDYDAMLRRQGGVCATCKRKFKQSLCVDHCHITGLLRGLLCKNCNVGNGYLGDSPRVMRNSADYTEFWWRRHMKQLGLTTREARALRSGRRKLSARPLGARHGSARRATGARGPDPCKSKPKASRAPARGGVRRCVRARR